MSPTITYFEFRAISTPFVAKLYPIGGVDDTILASAGSINQLDDPESGETGRWRASFIGLAARDYQLIATEGGGSVVADERYTLPSDGSVGALQPWSEAKPLSVADIAAAIGGGAGVFTVPLTIKLTGGSIVADCEVVLTSSNTSASVDIVNNATTDGSGVVTFNLNAGTYYVWRQKSGVNFNNPMTLTVSGTGQVTIE